MVYLIGGVSSFEIHQIKSLMKSQNWQVIIGGDFITNANLLAKEILNFS